jgi:DNA-binding MarR family transcriptional regulator
LAERVGRGPFTISRQTARLVEFGLVERRPNPSDHRLREAASTSADRVIARRIDDARNPIGQAALSGWTSQEVDVLVQSMRHFADAVEAVSEGRGPTAR